MFRRWLNFYKRRKIQKIIKVQKAAQSQNPYYRKESSEYGMVIKQWCWRDGWALAGVIILIFGTIWYFLLRSPHYILRHITVQGTTQFISVKDVTVAVQQYLEDRDGLIFPRNRFWTISEERLQNYLAQNFAKTFALKDLVVTKKYPDQLEIIISERIPSLTWEAIGDDITQTAAINEKYYSVDLNGIVTQKISVPSDVNPNLPLVKDLNRADLSVGWQIVSPSYIEFLLKWHEQFASKLPVLVDYYIFPQMLCLQKQYIAEKIFNQEILASASQEFKQKKIKIQEDFKAGRLTIDESLRALEQVKNDELAKLENKTNSKRGEGGDDREELTERVQWAAVDVNVECDFVKVATELHFKTKSSPHSSPFTVYLDTTADMTKQFSHLQDTLQLIEAQSIKYIDLRLPDRVFYQTSH